MTEETSQNNRMSPQLAFVASFTLLALLQGASAFSCVPFPAINPVTDQPYNCAQYVNYLISNETNVATANSNALYVRQFIPTLLQPLVSNFVSLSPRSDRYPRDIPHKSSLNT